MSTQKPRSNELPWVQADCGTGAKLIAAESPRNYLPTSSLPAVIQLAVEEIAFTNANQQKCPPGDHSL